MGKSIRYVGLDVHAATIAVALAEGRENPRSLGVIPNTPEAVRKLLKKLGDFPYWKWLPTVRFEHAAQTATLLDYIAEVEHQRGRIARLERAMDEAISEAPAPMKAVIEALQSMRGIAKVTAVTLAVEVGTFRRFERATQLMSYTGMVPSERSSGGRCRRGAITKTGNSHLRRVLVEAAHHYRHQPRLGVRQRALQRELSPQLMDKAWSAQVRLHRRHVRLTAKGKPAGKVITAVARELVGFIWDIARSAEAQATQAV